MYNRPLQFEMRHPLSSIRPNASSQSGGGSLAEAIRKAALASNRLPKDNEIMESTNLKSYLPLGRFREIEGMFDAIKAIHQAESPGAFEASSEEEFVDQWFAHDSQLDRGIRTALNTLDPSLSDTSRRQWLHVSGILLNRMYLKAGAVKDLNTAIDYARSAMSNPMADIRQLAWKEQKNRRSLAHINCPNLETALASLRINSQSTGIPELFSDENSPFFEHFNFPKEGAMNKWMFKTNLASYLGDRYLRLGEGDENIDQDIDEAIYFARQAILDTPSHSKDLPGRMNNLATLLGDRYSGLGSRADLCEAVKWARLSVQETSSDDDRELPGRLNNLAALLVDEGCGDRSQLLSQTDEAVCLLETATKTVSESSSHRGTLYTTLLAFTSLDSNDLATTRSSNRHSSTSTTP
ncbi:hypothetical protein QBC38DRAFT_226167 [Podospora fimiseda]|uniref:Uncharacterized protein n=1 Tax=Podospora fimiseda TaxID=252190 RepID=A0AAN7H400_9PEZI|nr:hypothetical protein QBC38DRAFT_226167 [Podospora fimiseda]